MEKTSQQSSMYGFWRSKHYVYLFVAAWFVFFFYLVPHNLFQLTKQKNSIRLALFYEIDLIPASYLLTAELAPSVQLQRKIAWAHPSTLHYIFMLSIFRYFQTQNRYFDVGALKRIRKLFENAVSSNIYRLITYSILSTYNN